VAEQPRELSTEECLERLGSHSVGRIGFCDDGAPQIYPVNFAVDNGSIVFRTSAYGPLATHVPHNEVAFEVDELDHEHHHGWSVIAHGQGETLDADETHDLTSLHMLEPWAAGSRTLHFRITPRQLTGRQFGGDH
jgi:nitroimidazol reductase NimA-like FMN-containing flavoprotein (pyridoxamine 5'-phosphate oxidase superfamily)